MTAVAALLLILAGRVRAQDKAPEAAPADKRTVELVQYFLKVPTAEASPKLIDPFLAVNTDTLPEKLRGKAAAKQVEINALLRLHERKKAGSLVYPAEGCTETSFVKPLNTAGFFPNYEDVTEDELAFVMKRTKCTEIDLGCRFSLLIFFQKGKPRIMKFAAADPIMAIVAESHNGGGTSQLFGLGITCEH